MINRFYRKLTQQKPLPLRLTLTGRAQALLVGLSIALLSGVSFHNLALVPFHPDEATQLYMSEDFDLLLTRPEAMAWQVDGADDLRQHYRELDAPITRYLLGLGRTVAGLKALPADWDWTRTWEDNRSAGAVPGDRLLLAGRMTITALLPLSLIFIYMVNSKLNGRAAGLLAVILMGTNALVLLHGRRAMAEGALLLGVCFALWSFSKGDRFPWLVGLGLALAFNAKQSSLALLPAGWIAVLWISQDISKHRFQRLTNTLLYFASFILVTLALNPYTWHQPVQASLHAWQARQELMGRQVATVSQELPDSILRTPQDRLIAVIANLYILPPAFKEADNYSTATRPLEEAYLSDPLHQVRRGFFWGSIFFGVSLFGLFTAGMRVHHLKGRPQRDLAIILLAGLFQVGALLLMIPLNWQRYVTPLIPFSVFFTAFAVTQIWALLPSLRVLLTGMGLKDSFKKETGAFSDPGKRA